MPRSRLRARAEPGGWIEVEIPLRVGPINGAILDLETTSEERETAEIVAVGVIDGGRALTRLRTKYTDYATFIREALALVSEIPQPLYAYGADYDEGVLRRQAEAVGLTPPELRWVNVMEWYKLVSDAH